MTDHPPQKRRCHGSGRFHHKTDMARMSPCNGFDDKANLAPSLRGGIFFDWSGK
jgi:hypothetical protein